MLRYLLLACLGVATVLLGCAPRPDNRQARLPVPVESTAVGPGDVFKMEIVGEKELPTEYQIASDGSVDLPYINRLQVQGLEPQQIAQRVRERLIAEKILTSPDVIVSVAVYNSKRITILGQVQKPGSFPHQSGLTLMQALSLAGGFNGIANQDKVVLTRQTKAGETTVTLSANSILSDGSPDIPLQAGDRIYVHERVF